MSKPEDAPAEYIQIIVRRGHAEEEGHHGGVWKIAYADFMTAMMAFFLVMWLVNASNTEMKASVASYFNPIKLSDNVIRKKGLRDVDGKANAEEAEAKADKPKSHGKSDVKSKADSQPLQPGEAVKLGTDEEPGAAPVPTDAPFGRDGNATKGGQASESGRAFRDPFNPFAPGQLMSQEGVDKDTTKGPTPGLPTMRDVASPQPPTAMLDAGKVIEQLRRSGPAPALRDAPMAGKAQDAGDAAAPAPGSEQHRQAMTGDAPAGNAKSGEAKSGARKAGEAKAGDAKSGEVKAGNARSGEVNTGDARSGEAKAGDVKRGDAKSGDAKSGEAKVGDAKAGDAKSGDAKTGDAKAADAKAAAGAERAKLEAAASGVLRDIRSAVQPIAGDGGPGIEVTVEGNGIVLSLTDTSTFGMFPIGSSEPSKQTIELINRIAPVLAANSKRIVVRGHTDSRVYRTEKYNNWRLSVSRAEAAYAMLVRSGIDESRFNRIEGYADRKLKDPKDPEAASNRRIEILLQQVAE
jgi:chemotaxis protein MotB